ncbi:hypothetical protein MNBD_GAMMA11-174 [hydrothermal vent metagenome]|uniref:Histidinol-phosphatase [alternative form] n=1 Tax=hydrothermal vent metagenome TaxID=652676 RepID=A0A3B0XPS1_9ZZZZ
MLTEKQIKQFLSFAHQLADEIGDIHRKYYRQPVSTDYKEDSSPVTQVDKESEAWLRERVMKQFPEHGILGEEYPPHQPNAEFVWVVDPVDGTKYFITGHPMFALLLGLAHQGKFILGVIEQAISRERWVGADHLGSFLNGQLISTRQCPQLSKAILARPGYEWHTEGFDHHIDNLWKAAHWSQWGVAPYDYGLLACGHIDIIVNAGPRVHDFAALDPVIRNAGGLMSDGYGKPLNVNSPAHIVAVGNAQLLPEVIRVLGIESEKIS